MFEILVAEDNKNSAKLMKIILTHAGYKVHLAENGKQALEMLDKTHIDLIVLDVTPGLSDFQKLPR